MDNWTSVLSMVGIGFFIGLFLCVGLLECSGTSSTPYMKGQIDAQTGIVHWSLKDNSDGSREWKHD